MMEAIPEGKENEAIEVVGQVCKIIEAGRDVVLFELLRASWSIRTFGPVEQRGPVGPLKHLEKEAREAYEETDTAKRREEIADCFFLVLDASMREGMTLPDLIGECRRKLEKNKLREWPAASSDEPVQHVKGVAD